MILNTMPLFFLKVEDIESKLDLLIDLYKEDRKPLLQHCQDCSQQNNMPVEHNQTEVTSCLKNPIISKPTTPRSILSDKHCSEPTSPTNARTPDKKMQRNLSDLSQRIKKRVTYRLLSLNDQSSLVKQNPSGPKRQRSASVDSADTGLCDTKNHTEEVSENEDQPIIIKDPPPPKKKLSRLYGQKSTNQNPECTAESEVPVVTTVTSEEVRIDLLNINHIVPDNIDLQNFPGYKPKA